MTLPSDSLTTTGRTSFPVASSILDPEALGDRIAVDYELPGLLHCRLISHGANDTYRVTINATTRYLRVTGYGWRNRAEIEAEVAVINALHARGVRVARPISRSDGAVISRFGAPEGERISVLFETAAGSVVYDIDLVQSRTFGRMAAGMHDAADHLDHAYSRPVIAEAELLHEPLAAIRDRFGDRPEEMAFLTRIAERVSEALSRLPRGAPDFGLCHGDLHPGNVCFDSSGAPTLIDLDLCGYGWRVYDISVFLWNAFGERRSSRWRSSRWRAFLAGYQESRPLSADALAGLPLFLVARQIWLMGLDCRELSGWPVQWLNANWLIDALRPIQGWESEFAILHG